MDNNIKNSDLLLLLKNKSPQEGLEIIEDLHPGKVVFTSSFGLEDQVITDMICTNFLDIKIITLDTGRLFRETYKVFSQTVEKYKKKIYTYYPDTRSVEELVTNKGPFSFYESVENRKECCYIRKVEPLNRALKDAQVWVTGIRADQSAVRDSMELVEMDNERGIIKYNPLLEWTMEEIKDYISKNNVPYNILHDSGFASIGCEPCTRAIKPGEDFRSGRWWWESGSKKECGLHLNRQVENK